MKLKKICASLAVVATTICAPQVQAASVVLDYDSSAFGSKTGTIKKTATATNAAVEVSAAIGGFDMNVVSSNSPAIASGSSILAWCVDIYHSLNTRSDTTYQVFDKSVLQSDFSADRISNLQLLINQNYKDLVLTPTANESAAMQMAIWEILFESGTTYNVGSGGFRVTGSNSSTARTLANGWLSALGTATATGDYRIVYLKDITAPLSQNLITISAVPLPGAALFFLSALGLGGVFSRFQKRAQLSA